MRAQIVPSRNGEGAQARRVTLEELSLPLVITATSRGAGGTVLATEVIGSVRVTARYTPGQRPATVTAQIGGMAIEIPLADVTSGACCALLDIEEQSEPLSIEETEIARAPDGQLSRTVKRSYLPGPRRLGVR